MQGKCTRPGYRVLLGFALLSPGLFAEDLQGRPDFDRILAKGIQVSSPDRTATPEKAMNEVASAATEFYRSNQSEKDLRAFEQKISAIDKAYNPSTKFSDMFFNVTKPSEGDSTNQGGFRHTVVTDKKLGGDEVKSQVPNRVADFLVSYNDLRKPEKPPTKDAAPKDPAGSKDASAPKDAPKPGGDDQEKRIAEAIKKKEAELKDAVAAAEEKNKATQRDLERQQQDAQRQIEDAARRLQAAQQQIQDEANSGGGAGGGTPPSNSPSSSSSDQGNSGPQSDNNNLSSLIKDLHGLKENNKSPEFDFSRSDRDRDRDRDRRDSDRDRERNPFDFSSGSDDSSSDKKDAAENSDGGSGAGDPGSDPSLQQGAPPQEVARSPLQRSGGGGGFGGAAGALGQAAGAALSAAGVPGAGAGMPGISGGGAGAGIGAGGGGGLESMILGGGGGDSALASVPTGLGGFQILKPGSIGSSLGDTSEGDAPVNSNYSPPTRRTSDEGYPIEILPASSEAMNILEANVGRMATYYCKERRIHADLCDKPEVRAIKTRPIRTDTY